MKAPEGCCRVFRLQAAGSEIDAKIDWFREEFGYPKRQATLVVEVRHSSVVSFVVTVDLLAMFKKFNRLYSAFHRAYRS